jgi:hypothetical protein
MYENQITSLSGSYCYEEMSGEEWTTPRGVE